jgi:signal transduction histidine kinase
MHSLQGKMIFSYLVIALITVLVVSAVIGLTSGRSLRSLVIEQQTALLRDSAQAYYLANGTMDGYFKFDLLNEHPAPTPGAGSSPGKAPKGHDLRGLNGLVDTEYRALIPTYGYDIGQIVPADKVKQAIAVTVNGKTVAWILPDTSSQVQLSSEEQLYLQRSSLAVSLAALAGVLAAVAMGFFLSGRLVKPISRLTHASKALARGALDQQVPVTSKDELGQLTATFNQMSADLVKADQQRKRMTADITHDLSTPLQIIAGYIEMLEEGAVTLTPQRIDIIKTEIGHLRRLVSDLSTLSQVESNGLDVQLQDIAPADLLNRILQAYQPIAARQEVEIVLDVTPNTPPILADEGRMLQVIKNLVDNALRYTPRGGRITLKAAPLNDQVQIRVVDTGSGIDPEDLPLVFDRFYQADKSRGANAGKMGLGLAICKALVLAQGGTITVESAGKDQGTAMIITFQRAAVPGG